MNTYDRIFGNGPLGLGISLLLFLLAWWIRPLWDLPILAGHALLRHIVFVASIALTGLLAMWSFRSLPPQERGRTLATRGAFRYVRHPLYASFLVVFNFGLALWCNHWVFVAWAILLHPIWHLLMRREERLMTTIFPEAYATWSQQTGRFIPRFWQKRQGPPTGI